MSMFGDLFGNKKDKENVEKVNKSKQEEKKDMPSGIGDSAKVAAWLNQGHDDNKSDDVDGIESPSVSSDHEKTDDDDKQEEKVTDKVNNKTESKAESEVKDEKPQDKTSENPPTVEGKESKIGKHILVEEEIDMTAKVLKEVQKSYPTNPSRPIVVSFMHDNKKIANDLIFTGKIGKKLTKGDLPTISGYKLRAKSNLNYKISNKEQHISLKYDKNIVKYDVIAVTEDKKQIDNTQIRHYEGRPGTTISSSKYPVVKGYRAYTSRKYIVPQEDGDVEVIYTPLMQTINISYQTSTGEVLDTKALHGKTGEEYHIDPDKRHFPGYEISKLPKQLSGKFPNENMDVTIYYAPVKSEILVSYIGENGKELRPTMQFEGKYKESYTITLPIIDGYELTSSPSLLNGYYDKSSKKIVLHYKRATVKFKVNYWFDKDFKQSAGTSREVSGLVGDSYNKQVPEIEGYKPDKQFVKGKFNPFENPDVDIVYSKIPTEVHISLVDEADRPLPNVTQIVKRGFWGDEFVAQLPEIPGYKRPASELRKNFNRAHQAEIVHYTPLEVPLTIQYINSKTGKEIVDYPAESKPGLAGTSYNIEPLMIDGYRLEKLPENASGVYTADRIVVKFLYEPNRSEIVIHRNATTLETIRKNEMISGYFGEKYEIKTDDIPGYKFASSSDSLKGTFPSSRLDIYLYYEAQNVSFTLVPINQFGKEIDKMENVQVTGKVGQDFSNKMPDIPGYIATATEISGKIKPEYNNEKIDVPYKPKEEQIIVHTLYSGGDHDGMHPFHDFVQPGPMGAPFEYEAPEIPGYEPSTKLLKAVYTSEPQELTIVYTVKQEEYMIRFVDTHDQMVGGMPAGKGYYREAIDISKSVPRGFHLPEGVDSHVYLDGSGEYNVAVIPDRLTIELIAQAPDGTDLGSRRQIDGDYNEVKELPALSVPGYKPVDGNTVKIKFELGETTKTINYEPEDRTLTIRYINATTGKAIKDSKVVHGKFNGEYDERAAEIPGFVAINRTQEKGTFGLQDIETVFLYRAGSDDLNPAITSLDQIIKENSIKPTQTTANAVVTPVSAPQVETPAYENSAIPSAQTTHSETIIVNKSAQTTESTLPEQPQQGVPTDGDGAVDLFNKLYGKENPSD